MSTPFKQLLAGATPGKWEAVYDGVGATSYPPNDEPSTVKPPANFRAVKNAAYIARLSPETMKKVVETLEFYADQVDVDGALPAIEALRELDGEESP